MNRFVTQESIISGFINILVRAGMQNIAGTDETKPKYFRGYVPKEYSDAALFLRYNVDDNQTIHSSDDGDFMRECTIGGEVYTRNGFGDSDYQDLCEGIETECKKDGYIIEWQNEETDASFDADSPIAIKRYTVTKNII